MREKIAVLLPCYNEEKAIGKVIQDFQKYLPEAKIYVYDNNSSDQTAKIASQCGAIVRFEPLQGKGNVVRRMFADIEADIYVLSDGDDTYDIKKAPDLIKTLQNENLDMVIGARQEVDLGCYRVGHRFGNLVLTKLVQTFFNHRLMDMLSGYRVFSKRFVKTFPATSNGFEIETELTIFALSSRLPIKEVLTNYFARPHGSLSKLSTFRDGVRILRTIVLFVKEERPLMFFSLLALMFLATGLGFGWPVWQTFLKTQTVPKFPTVVLVVGLGICGFVSLVVGLILESIAAFRKENRRQAYLRIK